MRIGRLMSKPAVTCGQDDSLNTAAQLMWEHDCGAVSQAASRTGQELVAAL